MTLAKLGTVSALLLFTIFIGNLMTPVLSFSTNIPQNMNIDLLSPSSSRFFDCYATVNQVEGAPFLRGLNANESAQSVLTDNDTDTMIIGKANFNILSHIINNAGPDLKVIEMAGAEPINASVTDPNTGKDRIVTVYPTPTESKNSCGHTINNAYVDLSDLGINTGSAVSSIRIDNLGYPDSLAGSDIAEILPTKQGRNATSTTIDITDTNSSQFLNGIRIPLN